MVREMFRVKDSFQLPEGEVEYSVEYAPESKKAFAQLHDALVDKGLTPWLTGTKDECVLALRKKVGTPPGRTRLPVILLLLTLATVVFISLLNRITYESFAPSIPGYLVLIPFWVVVGGALAVHQVGRRYVANRNKTPPPVSYAIPGIPFLTSTYVAIVLPTLGFVSVQPGPAINRDRLFGVMLVGPLLILAVGVAAYVAGAFASVQSSQPILACQNTSAYVTGCPSLIQSALDFLTAPFSPAVAPGYLRFSPLQDGATVGFLVAFISLLPMASFDGGYVASLVWGSSGARAATYLSVIALIVIDTPFYWVVAIVALLLAGRPVQPLLLDEVSELSSSRRFLYLGAIILGFLALPIPQNLGSFPL
jgi:hypothetical protein